jgi:HSP20 family protein
LGPGVAEFFSVNCCKIFRILVIISPPNADGILLDRFRKKMEVIMTNAMQRRGNQSYLPDTIDQIFNNTLRRFFDANLWDTESTLNTGTVPVNVRENENAYELDVIAPGCKKEDFQVQVKDNMLTISFQHDAEKNERDEKKGWVRNEYLQRSFSRSFSLDQTVNIEQISAGYTDGILRLTLPKSEVAKPRQIAIDVK